MKSGAEKSTSHLMTIAVSTANRCSIRSYLANVLTDN